MKIEWKNLAIWLVAVIALSFIQVAVREYFDFYSGSGFVSFLIGGYIGLICYPLLKVKFE